MTSGWAWIEFPGWKKGVKSIRAFLCFRICWRSSYKTSPKRQTAGKRKWKPTYCLEDTFSHLMHELMAPGCYFLTQKCLQWNPTFHCFPRFFPEWKKRKRKAAYHASVCDCWNMGEWQDVAFTTQIQNFFQATGLPIQELQTFTSSS